MWRPDGEMAIQLVRTVLSDVLPNYAAAIAMTYCGAIAVAGTQVVSKVASLRAVL